MQWMDRNALGWIVVLALVCVGITVMVFKRRRSFERGPRKGEAANPTKVKRQNPPSSR